MSATELLERGAVPAGQSGEQSRRHSTWTLAAVGFLAYYITVMWHEILGHGLALYLLGARHFILTSTFMHSSDGPFAAQQSTLGGRIVELAGPAATGVLGLLTYAIFRFAIRRDANLTLRHFLWLLTAINFFLGFAYLVFSGVFGVGDYARAIASLPQYQLLRALEIVCGALLCAATVRFFAVSFAGLPESLWRLSLIPYVSGTLVFCLAGLRVPNSTHFMIISVIPAALTGQAILLFVTPLARKLRVTVAPPQAIPASRTAILISLAFVVVIFLTAPGVHFTLR